MCAYNSLDYIAILFFVNCGAALLGYKNPSTICIVFVEGLSFPIFPVFPVFPVLPVLPVLPIPFLLGKE